jgi:hypothetical protein
VLVVHFVFHCCFRDRLTNTFSFRALNCSAGCYWRSPRPPRAVDTTVRIPLMYSNCITSTWFVTSVATGHGFPQLLQRCNKQIVCLHEWNVTAARWGERNCCAGNSNCQDECVKYWKRRCRWKSDRWILLTSNRCILVTNRFPCSAVVSCVCELC